MNPMSPIDPRADDRLHLCFPARLLAGPGCRRELAPLLQRLGLRRGLLVTDRFFAEQTPHVREQVALAAAAGGTLWVYDGGLPDPSVTLCDAATEAARAMAGAAGFDHVIALGGGSNIDLAKVLALTLATGRRTRECVGDLAGCRPLPLVAIPTTAGTGSEATPGAILVDPENATKVAVMDNALRPAIAVIDPELSHSCPPRVTADAGIDAFTHAIESYMTIDSARYDRAGHPDPGYSGRSAPTMLFARESIRLCLRWLEAAYRDGANTEARLGMAYASLYAGLSYGSAGLNAVHGIAYAVAGLTHAPHGTTNAVVLPYVLDALRDVRRAELLDVAAMCGLDVQHDPDAALRAVPVRVRALVAALGLPTTLAAMGIGADQLDGLTREALAVARLSKALPVPDVAARYADIVARAHVGRLAGDA